MFKNVLVKLKFLTLIALLSPLTTYAAELEHVNTSLATYPNIVSKFYGLTSTKNLTLLTLNGYQQTQIYTCGPAAVMSVLHYYGKLSDQQMNKTTELRIAKEMGTTLEKGTTPQQMVAWFEQHGFQATAGENGTISMLQDNLKKGIPTIVEWIDWSGHWVVATGYNKGGASFKDNKDTLFLADSLAYLEDSNSINGLKATNPLRFNYMWFDVKYFNPGHVTKGVYVIAIPKTNKIM